MSDPEKKPGRTIYSSEDSPLVEFDGPGENIRRPRSPNNPRHWPPGSEPPPEPQLPADQPPPDDARSQ